MVTNTEIKIMQKTMLYDLIMLKKDNEKSGIEEKGLIKMINKMEATMDEEDVAWVEKKISQFFDTNA